MKNLPAVTTICNRIMIEYNLFYINENNTYILQIRFFLNVITATQ